VFEIDGATQAQYDQVRNAVIPGNQAPPGLIYHAGGLSATGLCVIEVWESQEALDRFFQEKLGAALQEAGLSVQPRFFQVTNTITG
jgi:hypothetical protein